MRRRAFITRWTSTGSRWIDAAGRRAAPIGNHHACPHAAHADRADRQGRSRLATGTILSSGEQEYNPTPIINEIRNACRELARAAEPGRLGRHADDGAAADALAHASVLGRPPFFCQIEAVETRHLADRGRAASRPQYRTIRDASRKRQRRSPTPSCSASP